MVSYYGSAAACLLLTVAFIFILHVNTVVPDAASKMTLLPASLKTISSQNKIIIGFCVEAGRPNYIHSDECSNSSISGLHIPFACN